MDNLQKFYIDGAWVSPDSTNTMPVINPATEQIVATVALGNAADVDRAVAAANQAFKTFSMTSKQERLALLERIKTVTEARFEDLAQAMREEMGAPITFAREAQADAAIGHLQGFADALEQLEEEIDLGNGELLVREPIGVCGLITPWNWPINQIALKVLPALAAGCTCVLKPSEHTPLSAIIYAEILHDAGCPPGVFNLVNGEGPEVGTAMSKHPDIQMMSFTGSTRAGTAVTHDSAESVKRVTLELGGKSANLVFADSDLEERVQNAVAECMANTGQSCDAPTRLLVERSCYDEVVEIAKASGMEYARIVDETRNFSLPNDFLRWKPSTHQFGKAYYEAKNLENDQKELALFNNLTTDFLRSDTLALYTVWGHSWEMGDSDAKWNDLETCFKQIANSKAVCALTMIEVVDYLQAYKLLQVSETKHSVFNPSTITVFVSVDGKTYKIRPKSSLKLPK